MKTYMKTGVAIAAAALLAGCNGAEATAASAQKSEFDTLTEYMVNNNMDMNKVMASKTWIPHSAILAENISSYLVLDIRTGDVMPKNGKPDFKDGHIAGAVNVDYKDVVKYAQANNAGEAKKILVVSEDGQSASAAAVALRLSGFPNTKVLKFGMAGWNGSLFNNWSEHQTNFAASHKNWTKEPAAKPKTYSSKPELNTGKSTGAEILAARVDAFLAKGYQGITAAEVMEEPSKYYVVNQGTAKAYGQYGRIAGSQQFNWPMINPDAKHGSLANYPTDQEIVQYCWTGHAATTVSSWMDIIGYNAKGVKYGTNAMIHGEMAKKKYSPDLDLPVVTE